MFHPTIDLADSEIIQKTFSISSLYLTLNLGAHMLMAIIINYYLPSDAYSFSKVLNKYLGLNIEFNILSNVINIINYMLIAYILFIVISLLYLRLSNNYYLTNKRLIIREGLFNIEMKTIEYDKITDMETSQTFFERIISMSGDIFVSTAGTTELDANLYNIDSPTELKANINTLRDKVS